MWWLTPSRTDTHISVQDGPEAMRHGCTGELHGDPRAAVRVALIFSGKSGGRIPTPDEGRLQRHC